MTSFAIKYSRLAAFEKWARFVAPSTAGVASVILIKSRGNANVAKDPMFWFLTVATIALFGRWMYLRNYGCREYELQGNDDSLRLYGDGVLSKQLRWPDISRVYINDPLKFLTVSGPAGTITFNQWMGDYKLVCQAVLAKVDHHKVRQETGNPRRRVVITMVGSGILLFLLARHGIDLGPVAMILLAVALGLAIGLWQRYFNN
jgi:hypothetical protein